MPLSIDSRVLAPLQERLANHPIYGSVRTMTDLRIFMEHHVYSVWDFMSLIKFLQAHIAPAHVPWRPLGDGSVRRFINELVLEEESDLGLPENAGDAAFCSHFELYVAAMREIGADVRTPLQFVDRAASRGIETALSEAPIPEPSRRFTQRTFDFIQTGKPHVVAAALALGREHIIPGMFRRFLAMMGVGEAQAPYFHHYLGRHIHLDEDFHAPLSLRLLNELCAGEPTRLDEAVTTAREALTARLSLWDGATAAIEAQRRPGA
ncbi:MAG: DUF3050 domain-containing protein [Betaproteobacteria bacterium]|nr:DUF3050 domain-containing protein [Betaproteobacteria bacterium]